MSYAEVVKKPQRWLARDLLARDLLTLGAGAGGIAKGRVACSVVASVTRNLPFYGDVENELGKPMDVLAWTPEDRADTAMAWRLDAAGADRSRVHDFTKHKDGTPRKLDDAAFEEMILKGSALAAEGKPLGLIYIDPMSAVLPAGRNVSTNANARAYVIDPLDEVAEKLQCGILLNLHTVKDGTIQGSVGLTQAARLVLLYKRGKLGVCTMVVEKSNIGPDKDSVDPATGEKVLAPHRYQLAGHDDSDMRVEWLSATEPHGQDVRHLRSVPEPARAPRPAQRRPQGTSAAQLFHQLRAQGVIPGGK